MIFEIIDNGVGMNSETQQKIFALFFSSKGAEGTGLGLFVTQKIVEQHGGRIKVRSVIGHGSVFRVSIPQRASAEANPDRNAEHRPLFSPLVDPGRDRRHRPGHNGIIAEKNLRSALHPQEHRKGHRPGFVNQLQYHRKNGGGTWRCRARKAKAPLLPSCFRSWSPCRTNCFIDDIWRTHAATQHSGGRR
jgi:hypothetical protein